MQSAGSEWSKWDVSHTSRDSEDSDRLFAIDWFGFWLYYYGTTLLQIRGQFADGEAYGSSPLCHFPCMAEKRGGETGGPSDRCPLDGFSRGDLEPSLRCWSLPSVDPWGLFGRRRTNPASHSMVCPQGPRGHPLCHHHRRCCEQRFHGTGSSSRMGPIFPHRCGLRLVPVKTSGAIHHGAKGLDFEGLTTHGTHCLGGWFLTRRSNPYLDFTQISGKICGFAIWRHWIESAKMCWCGCRITPLIVQKTKLSTCCALPVSQSIRMVCGLGAGYDTPERKSRFSH